VPEAEKIGGAMMSVQRIDDLIETAWNVMEEEFNIRAVYRWKKEAVEFLADELGPNHHYTQSFKDHTREFERQNILTGGGILTAAKEVISTSPKMIVYEGG
jgi:uncharacterized protein (DUF2164 family)